MKKLFMRVKKHRGWVFVLCLWGLVGAGIFLKGRALLSFVSDQVGHFLGLSLRECLIEGRVRTSTDDVWGALGCSWGTNIFACSLRRVHENMKKLPWVKDVVIIRRLPSTLLVCIKEKKPMAVWQNNGKKVLISDEGDVIAGVPVSDDYLVVTGKDAPMHTWRLLKSLEDYKEKLPKVCAATFLRSQRWDIYLEDKTCVKLSEKNIDESLRRLVRVLQWQREKKRTITTIDLRFIDAVIMDMPDTMAKKPDISAQKKSSSVTVP